MRQKKQGKGLSNTKADASETLEKLTKRIRFTLFIAWLALVFTMVGIAAGYKNWMQINTRAKDASRGVELLKQQASEFAKKSSIVALNTALLDDLAQNSKSFNQSVDVLETVKKTTQQAVKSIDQQIEWLTQKQVLPQLTALENPSTSWHLAELHFLLQVANQRLQLHHDKKSALLALQAAETSIIKIGLKKYLPVRKKITEDIVQLETFFMPNIVAISQRIGELMNVIDVMPTADEIKKNEKTQLLAKPSTDKGVLFSQLVERINDAVVVHKFDASVEKTFGLNEKEKVQNLLQLRLESLRLMVLQGLDYDYHQQLKLIKQTLNKYYPEMITGILQKHLDELAKVKLSPTPPDISVSLQLLERLSKQKK